MKKIAVYLFIFFMLRINVSSYLAHESNTIGKIPRNLTEEPKSDIILDSVRVTILYDNYVHKINTQADWGFACLIEGPEKTILFDTGAKEDLLLFNIDKLNIDLAKVDQLVLSHNHSDHTGGVHSVISRNPDLPVFVPISFAQDFQTKSGIKNFHQVNDPTEICKNVLSTGEMGTQIKEQSLILNTKQGLVIITGCSHQGILEVLKKAKEIFNKDIYLVLGGFHLLQHSDTAMIEIVNEFKKMGVQKCGATHCTGDKQIQMFKEAYGDDYVEMGMGRIIILTDKGLGLN